MRGGGGPYFDGVSFHTYDNYHETPGQWSNVNWRSSFDQTGSLVIAKTRYFKKMLSNYGIVGKYLIDTEAAMICFTCTPGMRHETAAGWYIPELFAAGMLEGLKSVIYYSYEGWLGSGLITSSGAPAPAMAAYRTAYAKFGNANSVNRLVPTDVGSVGVLGYKFKQGSRTTWLLRSLTAQPRALELAILPSAITDPFGNPITPTKTLTLTLMPIYIEWN